MKKIFCTLKTKRQIKLVRAYCDDNALYTCLSSRSARLLVVDLGEDPEDLANFHRSNIVEMLILSDPRSTEYDVFFGE